MQSPSLSGSRSGSLIRPQPGSLPGPLSGSLSGPLGPLGPLPGSLSGSLSGGPREAATADLSGRCVGNSYVLVCPVGHGATGTVWRGIDRTSGTDVAVKLLHEGLLRQPKLVIRFVQERTILMMMRHENIVGVHDLFSVGGSLALVMDYVAGGSLRGRLHTAGTLPPSEAARLLAQVAAALAQAHELGVVHRDVKPDNILLQEVDGRHDVRLTDFGIARVLDAAGLTTPQAIVGTPHYMAPEAIQGEAEPASDVYAVGIVLYELVTGHPPYAGEPLGVLHCHLEDTVPRPPAVPGPVWEVIEWCLDKDPARRPTAADLGVALRELARRTAGMSALTAFTQRGDASSTADLLGGLPHPSAGRHPVRRRRPVRNNARSWKWRRPGMMITLVAAAAALSGLGGYHAWEQIGARDKPSSVQAAPPPAALGGAPAPAPSVAVPSAPAASAAPAAGAALPIIGEAGAALPSLPVGAAGRVSAGASAGPVQAGAQVEFGSWRCGDEYTWDLGHPVLAKPCVSLGPSIRVLGQMEAAPGLQIDLTLTVRDAETDKVVAGPYVCDSLMFTDFALKHNCGPVEMKAPRGHRYVVGETWRYTQRPLLPGGSARGVAFDW